MKHQKELFPGPGEMRTRMRAFDWASSPVGPVSSWPRSLTAKVKLLLASRYPMILIWGSNYVQFYNDAYSKLIGEKHPSALGTDIRVTLAEAWDTLGPMVEEVMRTRSANWVPSQLLVLERSGYREESYFSLSHAPAEDDEGVVRGMFGVCSEVTQQILGERRLRLLRDLASRTGEARSVQTTCNDIASTIAEHKLDVPFVALYLNSPKDRALLLQASVNTPPLPHQAPLESHQEEDPWFLTKAATTGESIVVGGLERYEQVTGGPWNEQVHEAVVFPIPSTSQHPPLGVLVAGISPNRALDENYRSFYELLAGQVSVAIKNAQAYEEERKRAEALAELDRSKTAFFSNISHEFRTPLTLMLSPLEETLKTPDLPIEIHNKVTIAHKNSLRLLKLVNALLDFSRIEAGRMKALYVPTDLAALTEDLASVFRSIIEGAGLSYTVECNPLSESVYVDPDMWEKIVLNLISNAFKFTLRGEITIRQYLNKDNQVELQVLDTGIGIPEKELSNVFKRFHRIEGRNGRTYEGTGIGLSLVQELVLLHGGEVQVESQLNQGTSFIVRIPLGVSHIPKEQRGTMPSTMHNSHRTREFVEEALRWGAPTGLLTSPEEQKSIPTASDVYRPKILLADDNSDMREYVSRLLQSAYEVEVVSNGEEAWAHILKSPPDLVLSDVMMPELDGFGLLHRIRGTPPTRTIPFILLSARAGEESRIEGLDAGADDYLVKPFHARELFARVKGTLEAAKLREETARAIAESEAAKERAVILDRVTDAFYAVDNDFRFTFLNKRCEEYYRKTREELIGKSIWEIFPETKGSLFEIFYKKALNHQETVHFEVLSPFSHRWVEVHAYPSKDGLSVNFRDITARKELEEQKAQLLESERAARSAMEKAARIKDEFLATVSHELRTPLNAILGWSQLLKKRTAPGEDTYKGLEIIERSARAQTSIINDLLDMSKIVSGKIALDLKRVDFRTIVDAALQGASPAAQEKSIQLHLDTAWEPLIVRGDSNRLQQVVWNLLSNATKFTPSGGHISVKVRKCENEEVELQVIDSGQGISSEFLPHIFDRFRQADSSTTRKFGGLGLGLSIVKDLVSLHDGTVSAFSKGEQQGATFTVRLPLDERQSDVIPEEPTLLHAQLLASLGKEKILGDVRVLVVDDEQDFRELIKRLLEECGAQVFIASSADEGLQLLQHHKVDVIVSDIGMPYQDGYEFIRKVRKLPEPVRAATPAAAVTAFARFEDRLQALHAGYQTHVAKPIEPAELIAVVSSLSGHILTQEKISQ